MLAVDRWHWQSWTMAGAAKRMSFDATEFNTKLKVPKMTMDAVPITDIVGAFSCA